MRFVRLPYCKRVEWRGIGGTSNERWCFPLVIFGFTFGSFTITQEDK